MSTSKNIWNCTLLPNLQPLLIWSIITIEDGLSCDAIYPSRFICLVKHFQVSLDLFVSCSAGMWWLPEVQQSTIGMYIGMLLRAARSYLAWHTLLIIWNCRSTHTFSNCHRSRILSHYLPDRGFLACPVPWRKSIQANWSTKSLPPGWVILTTLVSRGLKHHISQTSDTPTLADRPTSYINTNLEDDSTLGHAMTRKPVNHRRKFPIYLTLRS